MPFLPPNQQHQSTEGEQPWANKMAEPIQVPFGEGTMNHVLGGGHNTPEKGQFLEEGGHLAPHCEYRKYSACSQYSQPYSVGGRSDAAFQCQCHSNLFLIQYIISHTNDRQWNVGESEINNVSHLMWSNGCSLYQHFGVAQISCNSYTAQQHTQ